MATSVPQEKVFRLYSAEEGKFYAAQRLSYPPALYNVILEHHATTGGKFGLLLDVGCGPGNSTRDLATRFEKTIGVDASPGMIDSARELGGEAKSGTGIRFEVSTAEAYSQVEGLQANSVDLLTAAAAAHWFDMAKFWREAAIVMKPGGTVAIWTRTYSTCHPSTKNADKIKEILRRFQDEILRPWEQPGSRLSRDLYENLLMPWASEPPVASFPEDLFVKHEYDKGGVLSDGKDFFGGGQRFTLEIMKKGLSTASTVKKWRQAHPDLVGTELDVANVLAKELKEVMGDETTAVGGGATAILLFKKPASLNDETSLS